MQLQHLEYALKVEECGSISTAAAELYLSQPRLSEIIRNLESELGIRIFNRSPRGVSVTPDGAEFLGYARQITDQAALLERRYHGSVAEHRERLSITLQHYAFATRRFIKLLEDLADQSFDLALKETRTAEVISDVHTGKSDLGILYLSDANKHVLGNTLAAANLHFTPLFDTAAHVVLRKGHPLANREAIALSDLEQYTRLAFDQDEGNSFFFFEEPYAEQFARQRVTVSDRSTLTELLLATDGYNIATGVLVSDLQSNLVSIPIEDGETMQVGYLTRKDGLLSELALRYIGLLKEYARR